MVRLSSYPVEYQWVYRLLVLFILSLFLFNVLRHIPVDQTIPEPDIQVGEDTIKLAWFYRPPVIHTEDEEVALDSLIQNFDTFILTKNDEPHRDKLREQGVDAPFLQYLALDVIIDPRSCTRQPWRNQVADEPGDFCYIDEHHPDWFLLGKDGERMYREVGDGMRSVVMDPGHPGWRAFWLERARLSQETLGWDGVFLDNVEANLTKRKRRGILPADYPTDASYQAAVEGFLAYLYSEYFKPEGRPLYANVIEVDEPEVWFRYLRYLDGGMIEGWAVDWSNHYLKPSVWEEHLRRAEQTQQQGKHAILVAQGSKEDQRRQTFAYASYLLITNGRASFRYTHSEEYDEPWLYDNYDLELGEPLGPRYLEGYGIWKRDFSNGSVQVDFLSHSATIISTQEVGNNVAE